MAEKDKFANEMLTDDELDNVAGGTCYEMADDSRFLNSLNGSTDRYGATKCWFDMGIGSIREEIINAWVKVGIKAVLYNSARSINTYRRMDTNELLTQEQARQYAMEQTGHFMTEKDWKW